MGRVKSIFPRRQRRFVGVNHPSQLLAKLTIALLSSNFVYISIFATLQVCLTLDAGGWFLLANGNGATSIALTKASGVFGFLAGLLGFYTTAHYLCEDALPFDIPMGDTSRIVARWRRQKIKK